MTLTSREATGAIAFALIIVAGLWAYRSECLALQGHMNGLRRYETLVHSLQEDPEFLLREHHAQRRYDIPARPTEPDAGEQPQLVVFTDFQCPACYCKSLWIRNRAPDLFADNLTVRIRHYPLCRQCNSNVQEELHDNACQAAYAAEAARVLGGEEAFRRMHDLLFENRKQLGQPVYSDLAARIGLDTELFLREIAGERVRRTIASDIALAKELGVHGTPTMLLNGRRVTALCQTPVFWRAAAQSYSASPEPALALAPTVNQDAGAESTGGGSEKQP